MNKCTICESVFEVCYDFCCLGNVSMLKCPIWPAVKACVLLIFFVVEKRRVLNAHYFHQKFRNMLNVYMEFIISPEKKFRFCFHTINDSFGSSIS